jgi:hypothetical protein
MYTGGKAMLQLTEFSRAQLADLARGRLVHERYQQQQGLLAKQLRRIGADAYDLRLPETHTLPLVVQPNERMEGIVYGRYVYRAIDAEFISRGAVVITNTRVLLVNKKPFYVSCEEVAFDRVSGITYNRVGPIGHVILHTKLGDIDIRTFNQQCARHFTKAVEAKLYNQERRGYDNASY